MKGIWGIIAVVAILIVAGGIFSSYYTNKPKPGGTVPYKSPVACDSCGKAYITMIGDPPIKCHYCSETAVWPALQCASCNNIFPIVEAKFKASRVCPKCGKNKFKEVSPNGLETIEP